MMTDVRRDLSSMLEGRTIADMLRLTPGADALAFDI
jgi:hypothetical protein